MTATAPVLDAWATFQAATADALPFRPPETEAEYDALVAFAGRLTDDYNCNEGPQAALFDLVAAYIGAWEAQHESSVRDADVPPHELLAFYLDVQGLSQSQLAREVGVPQQNLSEILRGERGVSVALAKKLAARFGKPLELFL